MPQRRDETDVGLTSAGKIEDRQILFTVNRRKELVQPIARACLGLGSGITVPALRMQEGRGRFGSPPVF